MSDYVPEGDAPTWVRLTSGEANKLAWIIYEVTGGDCDMGPEEAQRAYHLFTSWLCEYRPARRALASSAHKDGDT